jgi:hypothetical protein
VFKKRKELPLDRKVFPTQTTTHTKNLMTDLIVRGQTIFFFGLFGRPSFDGLVKTTTMAKQILTREQSHCQRLSITLRYLATGNILKT